MTEREIGDDRGPKPPKQKEPNRNQIPEEKDPPSRRRGPVEDPLEDSTNTPIEAATDPDIEKQGEVRFS